MPIPHKCPTCNGFKRIDDHGNPGAPCPTCDEGNGPTGIVWEHTMSDACKLPSMANMDIEGMPLRKMP